MVVPIEANAQVTEEWVVRYNGPGNNRDTGSCIASDSYGNVYVMGESEGSGTRRDYTIIKYDPLGNILWLARYNNPDNGVDRPLDMTIDSQGNAYVTGYSEGGGTSTDYVTIKYDTNGNQLWVTRYDGPANNWDEGRAIFVDLLGNVYVSGMSYGGSATSYDYATIKYDSNGNELWAARYDGPGDSLQDIPFAITVDFVGNVYVTGECEGDGTILDYATVKYDAFGNLIWERRYNGPANDWDRAHGIAVDPSGNVIVTGETYSGPSWEGGTYYDYTTIAYDPSGDELWVAKYNGPGNFVDRARDLAIDSQGNIYVTGQSYGGTGKGYDIATIKYDSSGNELWVAREKGEGRNMALDYLGNIYVVGRSGSSTTSWDYVTVAHDSSGNLLWRTEYNGPGNGPDLGNDICVDFFGNVYVTGSSLGIGTEKDFTTIKYSTQKPILEVTINIDPDTINLDSKGRWVTCYINLPTGHDVYDIDISTVILEDMIQAEWGDIQNDTLMVKFDRSDVEDMLSLGTYNLKVTGELIDGTVFEGYSDEIRVIDPPK